VIRRILPTAWPVLAALLFTSTAGAGAIWVEVPDAGQLPATAQVTLGLGPLDFIQGTLAGNNDEDMYLISIPNPTVFSATTVGQPGTLLDTQLFLFNASGLGIEANDDAFLGTLRSSLPAGNPNAPTTPGLYLLAISSFNNDPLSPGGLNIFPNPSGVGETVGPTGPGGDLPVSSWNNLGTNQGTYQIALTGAEFVPETVIPEPTSVVLFAVGIVGLIGYGRRWRKQAV
jgi:hypothetical protein